MTDVLNSHTEHLEQVSSASLQIKHTLDSATASAKLLNGTLNVGTSHSDWMIRFGGPVAVVVLGNYGLSPSLSQNLQLLAGGKCCPTFSALLANIQ
jgi:hypothetical protein